jgi:geranylgeranyl pyrophosphate synthase
MPLDAIKQNFIRPLAEVEILLDETIASIHEANTHRWMAYFNQRKGHRLRPLLVMLSYYTFQPLTVMPEELITVAACMELIHTASLIHDDVIDAESVRRGQPALNQVKGNKAAILIGNVFYLKAFQLAFDLPQKAFFPAMAATATDMCCGEIIQSERDGERLNEAEYLEIIGDKTARLMALSCQAGAMLAEAPPVMVQRMADAGLRLGYLYQMRDDQLDWDVKLEPQVELSRMAHDFYHEFLDIIRSTGGNRSMAEPLEQLAALIVKDLV